MRGMTLIVKTIARLLGGFIFLYGLYIVLHGHLTPGGGFAGGVIIAGGFILLTLAYGKNKAQEELSEAVGTWLESLGGVLFLSIALLGIAGGYFFLNIFPKGHPLRLFSAGIIPVCNIAISMKVGAGLFAIFLAFVVVAMGGRRR